ncbi:uncharacterized protein LOC124254953 isoform X2 [Haliotis rubra]|uniref:uncharacterized protein LOC124254953 isoform X2 n=2 Tax=Haliotis rubra TaxID=36100 RepID=UPI001EE5F520|nr:uncharacterized protein LOC124254953 isoform X2 [Haliotis rubra]
MTPHSFLIYIAYRFVGQNDIFIYDYHGNYTGQAIGISSKNGALKMEYSEGFPDVSLEYDCGTVQSAGTQEDENWTMPLRMKVLKLLQNINQCFHVLIPLALDPESLRTFFLPLPQIQEIQDLLREDSPIKMLGIFREHNNPYINILTLFYENASDVIMVWIYRQNLVLNTTVVHTKLVPPGGMALKDLLQKQDVDNKNITVAAEFLSGQRKVFTSHEDIINKTCLLSIMMSAN